MTFTHNVWGITPSGSGTFLAVGTGEEVKRSNNGGLTWGDITSGLSAQILATVASDGGSIITVGQNSSSGHIWQSPDSGVTFNKLAALDNPFRNGSDVVYDINYHGGSSTFYVTGQDGATSAKYYTRSTDGGLTYGAYITHPFSTATRITVTGDATTGIVGVGGLGAARSADTGATWGTIDDANPTGVSAGNPLATDFAGVWCAHGVGSAIWRSTDDGANWSNVKTTTGAIRRIETDRANVWIAVGDNNEVRRSSDNGATWGSAIATGMTTTSEITSVATNRDGVWVIGNTTGQMATSSDNGVTFTKLGTNPFSGVIADIIFHG